MSIEGEADFAVCFFCKRYQCPNIDTWSNFFQIAVSVLSKRLIQVTTYIIITSVLISVRKKAQIDKKKKKTSRGAVGYFLSCGKTLQTNFLASFLANW